VGEGAFGFVYVGRMKGWVALRDKNTAYAPLCAVKVYGQRSGPEDSKEERRQLFEGACRRCLFIPRIQCGRCAVKMLLFLLRTVR
jgi:hypothetical protein